MDKIKILDINKENIVLEINGEPKHIPNDITTLKKELNQNDSQNFQVGEKIYNIEEIGNAEFKTIINQHYQESKNAFRLRIFLLIFVPVLAISLGYFIYQYLRLQQPLSLTVKVKNLTPNPYLPQEEGTLTLSYKGESKTKSIGQEEISFTQIAANAEEVKLEFRMDGFKPKDTSFLLEENYLMLPIERNDDLAKMKGIVKNDNGDPLEGATISIQDHEIKTQSKNDGSFSFDIPFEKQRPKQRLLFSKEGYNSKDVLTPVIPNETIRINLTKK